MKMKIGQCMEIFASLKAGGERFPKNAFMDRLLHDPRIAPRIEEGPHITSSILVFAQFYPAKDFIDFHSGLAIAKKWLDMLHNESEQGLYFNKENAHAMLPYTAAVVEPEGFEKSLAHPGLSYVIPRECTLVPRLPANGHSARQCPKTGIPSSHGTGGERAMVYVEGIRFIIRFNNASRDLVFAQYCGKELSVLPVMDAPDGEAALLAALSA